MAKQERQLAEKERELAEKEQQAAQREQRAERLLGKPPGPPYYPSLKGFGTDNPAMTRRLLDPPTIDEEDPESPDSEVDTDVNPGLLLEDGKAHIAHIVSPKLIHSFRYHSWS